MRLAALLFYVVPRVLVCAAALAVAWFLHWLLGVLATVVLVPTAIGFYGEYRDAIARAGSREVPP
jgi:hypothetical protein